MVYEERQEFSAKYRKPACREMKRVARKRSTISYSDLGRKVGMPTDSHTMQHLIGGLLGEISCEEDNAGRPMLSALVVTEATGLPGRGFFGLAVDLGKLPAGASGKARNAFWKKELKRVHAVWANGEGQGER